MSDTGMDVPLAGCGEGEEGWRMGRLKLLSLLLVLLLVYKGKSVTGINVSLLLTETRLY